MSKPSTWSWKQIKEVKENMEELEQKYKKEQNKHEEDMEKQIAKIKIETSKKYTEENEALNNKIEKEKNAYGM